MINATIESTIILSTVSVLVAVCLVRTEPVVTSMIANQSTSNQDDTPKLSDALTVANSPFEPVSLVPSGPLTRNDSNPNITSTTTDLSELRTEHPWFVTGEAQQGDQGDGDKLIPEDSTSSPELDSYARKPTTNATEPTIGANASNDPKEPQAECSDNKPTGREENRHNATMPATTTTPSSERQAARGSTTRAPEDKNSEDLPATHCSQARREQSSPKPSPMSTDKPDQLHAPSPRPSTPGSSRKPCAGNSTSPLTSSATTKAPGSRTTSAPAASTKKPAITATTTTTKVPTISNTREPPSTTISTTTRAPCPSTTSRGPSSSIAPQATSPRPKEECDSRCKPPAPATNATSTITTSPKPQTPTCLSSTVAQERCTSPASNKEDEFSIKPRVRLTEFDKDAYCNHLPTYEPDELQKVFREETTYRNGTIKGKFTYQNSTDQRYKMVHYTRIPYGPVTIDSEEDLAGPENARSQRPSMSPARGQQQTAGHAATTNVSLHLRNILPSSFFGLLLLKNPKLSSRKSRALVKQKETANSSAVGESANNLNLNVSSNNVDRQPNLQLYSIRSRENRRLRLNHLGLLISGSNVSFIQSLNDFQLPATVLPDTMNRKPVERPIGANQNNGQSTVFSFSNRQHNSPDQSPSLQQNHGTGQRRGLFNNHFINNQYSTRNHRQRNAILRKPRSQTD